MSTLSRTWTRFEGFNGIFAGEVAADSAIDVFKRLDIACAKVASWAKTAMTHTMTVLLRKAGATLRQPMARVTRKG